MKLIPWRSAFLARIILAIVPLLSAKQAFSEDWESWRGPHQNGILEAPGLFSRKGFGLKTRWKRDLGSGYSGVSIAGGKVLTMFTDGSGDFVGAFSVETGELMWSYRLGPMYRAHDGGHDGPVSTPIADEGGVFALGADGSLVALSLEDGKERWRVSLVQEFQASTPFWGFCTTPVVVGNMVVVQAGGRKSLVALDKKTGVRRWEGLTGEVEYRSPVVATLHGKEQLLVTTDRKTHGVDPSTGRVLWSLPVAGHFSATPVPVGDDRVLVTVQSGAVLYRISPDGKSKRVFRTREFRSSYAMPVPFGESLFGFTEHYLTCLDVKSGKVRWRSREPGGKGIIIVDGHLVILGAKGDVVIAKASNEGYEETIRHGVSDADGYSWPSFSDGVIYVRNLRHLAAVETHEAPLTVAESSPLVSRFARKMAEIAASKDVKARLDQWMESQTSFPVVENDRFVHFVYRGPATDVGIRGNMIAHLEEDPLHRLSSSDFFYRTYLIEPGARWEYAFNVDFGTILRDPLNPRTAAGERGGRSKVSVVATSGWSPPPFLDPYEGNGKGEMDSFRHQGRRIRVFLPPGYAGSESRYGLTVVTDGEAWIEDGNLPNTVNHLTESRIEPTILAFVDGGRSRELGGMGTKSYAAMLARQLVPELERRYRTRGTSAFRTILGKRGGAVAAVGAALAHPTVFGQCVAISYGRADTIRAQWIEKSLRKVRGDKPRFFIGWNRYDIWRPQSFDVRTQSRALVADLTAHGFQVLGGERLDGAGWESWKILAGEAFLALSR